MEAKKTDNQNAPRNRPSIPIADTTTTQTTIPNATTQHRATGRHVIAIVIRRTLELEIKFFLFFCFEN
jgi:hypothetical protein